MRLAIGQLVYHEKYGTGRILDAWHGKKKAENYAVKFEKGGPQGFAENATHDASELRAT